MRSPCASDNDDDDDEHNTFAGAAGLVRAVPDRPAAAGLMSSDNAPVCVCVGGGVFEM